MISEMLSKEAKGVSKAIHPGVKKDTLSGGLDYWSTEYWSLGFKCIVPFVQYYSLPMLTRGETPECVERLYSCFGTNGQ